MFPDFMHSPFDYIFEGFRISKRALTKRISPVRRYDGDIKEICTQIIDDCWNGDYFQVSAGHFTEFYARDLYWCSDALIRLGYKDKVRQSLSYSLSIYKKYNKITTTITPLHRPIDIYSFSPDSLPCMMRMLRTLKADDLINEHLDFIVNQVYRYHEIAFDPKTSMIKEGKSFSSIKDNVTRSSSCYDNTMVAMLSDDLEFFSLPNPFKKYDIKGKMKKELWNGKYFYDDMRKKDYVAGDANVFPYYTGVFTDKKMMKSSIKAIVNAGLDEPFPLKYTKMNDESNTLFFTKLFVSNYEGNVIWAHMAPLYMNLVKRIDTGLFNKYLRKYKEVISEHGNYLEVFEPDGRPYRTLFYHTDESMLWASMILDLMGK